METLQAALARPGPGLCFEPALEQAYERDTGARRGKRFFFCNLLGTVVFFLLSAVDLRHLSHAGETLVRLRVAVLVFCGLGLLRQWRRLRHLPPRDREWLTALGAMAMSGYVAVEAHAARDVLGVMIGSHMLPIFLFGCLLVRLRFPFAAMVTVVGLLAYAVGATAFDPLTEAMVRNHHALFIGAALISLPGNFMLERKERRAYLMQRLSLLQRDAVQASAEALRRLTLHDPLTGLANRRHFDSEARRLWCSTPGRVGPVGVLQIDVDFFKRYNDSCGHPMGDVCLQRVAACLEQIARAHGGLAARIGGEEFAVLLPGLDLPAASAAAERACHAVRALAVPHPDSPAAAVVTVSVGVASWRCTGGSDPAALMIAADLALYRAKREGRDRFAQADPAVAATGERAAAPPPGQQAAEHDAAPRPGSASAGVAALSGLLAAGLHRVRFPPEFESAYQEQAGLRRQRQLALVVLAGLIATCGFTCFSLPLHDDIAPELLRGTLLLCVVLALPWAAVWQRTTPIAWRQREGLLSATALMLLAGLLMMASPSSSPGAQSGTLGLSLIPIVSAVISAPPVRFGLPSSLLLCSSVAALTWASEPADRDRWLAALTVLSATSVYSLVGAYVLDLSNRRDHLLRRLSDAQIAELQEIQADLQRLALTDPLTRLPNRRHFEAQLASCWADCRTAGAPLALLILDIDHFKAYNDGYGHFAGDAALQTVGAVIAEWCATRPGAAGPCAAGGNTAWAARLGGEEFGVLLPGVAAAEALAAADALCASLRARRSPHAHSPVAEVLTASIGVASLAPSTSPDTRELLLVADEALYRAKTCGRNRVSA